MCEIMGQSISYYQIKILNHRICTQTDFLFLESAYRVTLTKWFIVEWKLFGILSLAFSVRYPTRLWYSGKCSTFYS